MPLRVVIYFVSFALFVQSNGGAVHVGRETQEKTSSELRARIKASPVLPFKGVHFQSRAITIAIALHSGYSFFCQRFLYCFRLGFLFLSGD